MEEAKQEAWQEAKLHRVARGPLFFMMLALGGAVAAPAAEAQTEPQRDAQTGVPVQVRAQPDPEQVESALRECRDRLQTVEAEAVMPEADVPLLPQGDLSIIREAALAFARAGYEEGCEEVAESLQTLLQERREVVERYLELQRVREAIPITALPFTITTSELVGSDVVNDNLEEIGTLEDLILTENAGSYALIKHGGFLGLGTNYTPVPLERVRMTEDGELLVVHVAEEKFADAPEIDPDQLAEVEAWSQTIDQWWIANVGSQPGAGQTAQPQAAPKAQPQAAPEPQPEPQPQAAPESQPDR